MAETDTETPAALGYRMPAEWEPHEATWIAWPHHRDDWPGKFAPVPWVYTEIVRHLARVERVNILVKGRRRRERAAEQLDDAGVDLGRVAFVSAATDRVWVRDSGPTFVVNGRPGGRPDRSFSMGGTGGLPASALGGIEGTGGQATSGTQGPRRAPTEGGESIDEAEGGRAVGLIDWRFNGWAKYENHRKDDRLPRRIARRLGLPRWVPRVDLGGRRARVVMEGGAIDVNGRGTLLTTEECLLSPIQARNPGLDRDGVNRVFADYLGARHVVWLGRGIDGDDTHGHVDDLARFVDPSTVVVAVERRASDPNYEPLRENWRRLNEARDQDGEPLRVVALPMPGPVAFEGIRLPASYANFYIANGLVLVPTFNDPADREALNILADLFPGRQVVGIHAVDLVLGLGTLHCLSQQQPGPG